MTLTTPTSSPSAAPRHRGSSTDPDGVVRSSAAVAVAPGAAVEELGPTATGTAGAAGAASGFSDRHIGPDPADVVRMLRTVGFDGDLDAFVGAVVPEQVRDR